MVMLTKPIKLLFFKMTRVSQIQMKKLLDLLREDGVMVHDVGGLEKLKLNVKQICLKKIYDFIPQPQTLTNLELRLLRIIGYPMNNSNLDTNCDMIHKVEIPDDTESCINLEFLAEGSNENDKTLKNFSRHERKNIDSEDVIDDKSDVYDDLSDPGDRTKRKAKKTGNKLRSFIEYRIQTKLTLEKETSKQKSEELRLRAIELKLKGDELRLKEVEINKVNYLTGLEEEKLKCFREVSSSLKELLERTRNGNVSFNNVM